MNIINNWWVWKFERNKTVIQTSKMHPKRQGGIGCEKKEESWHCCLFGCFKFNLCDPQNGTDKHYFNWSYLHRNESGNCEQAIIYTKTRCEIIMPTINRDTVQHCYRATLFFSIYNDARVLLLQPDYLLIVVK